MIVAPRTCLSGPARTPPKWVLLGIALHWLMGAKRNPSPRAGRRRRADADRSVARILEATVEVLASDPDASMADIARHAGVVRATIYVHFANRESLIAAATWHLAMLRALVHAASAEFQAGSIAEARIEAALVTTVLGALAARPTNSDSAHA